MCFGNFEIGRFRTRRVRHKFESVILRMLSFLKKRLAMEAEQIPPPPEIAPRKKARKSPAPKKVVSHDSNLTVQLTCVIEGIAGLNRYLSAIQREISNFNDSVRQGREMDCTNLTQVNEAVRNLNATALSFQSLTADKIVREDEKKKRFIAVAIGYQPGIYDTWTQAQNQVNNFQGARWGSFATMEEAKRYMQIQESTLAIESKPIPMETTDEAK